VVVYLSPIIIARRVMEEAKRWRTAAIFYSIGGLLFIIVGAIGDRIGVFLPIGIALVILSMAFWQHSKKPTDNEGNT
jgi:drug/metabolite transporter (DMT)-like permease